MISTIENYISQFPIATQESLLKVHQLIKKIVPDAEEVMSYGIPTFKLNGNLVHYGGYKNHIGFYPGASGIEKFKVQLSAFKGAKGSVQFPLDKEIPFKLIEEIVRFRVEENIAKAAKKKNLRVCKNGHKYFKSSDCPICPVCEEQQKPQDSFLSKLGAPARRALERINVSTPLQLSKYAKKEILELHGIGPSSIPKLENALNDAGLEWSE